MVSKVFFSLAKYQPEMMKTNELIILAVIFYFAFPQYSLNPLFFTWPWSVVRGLVRARMSITCVHLNHTSVCAALAFHSTRPHRRIWWIDRAGVRHFKVDCSLSSSTNWSLKFYAIFADHACLHFDSSSTTSYFSSIQSPTGNTDFNLLVDSDEQTPTSWAYDTFIDV